MCVHGTYKKNLDSILESGLKRMQRLHVHFSSGLPTDGQVISGKLHEETCFLSCSFDIHGFMISGGDNRVSLSV